MNGLKCCLFGAMVCALTSPAMSQEKSAKQSTKKVPPEFAAPDVDPTLPNVLLIGDSISIGYTVEVRELLAGHANVWRPPTNCGPTTRGLESLEEWLGDRKWDVIHFNFGLHDLKYMGEQGENLAEPTAAGSHQQVPIDKYSANLLKIAERLKATGATVIWRETTPVPSGAKGREPADAERYNAAAAEVMAQVGGIQTDAMYDFAKEKADLQRPRDVHYTPAGNASLAKHVADTIRATLNIK